MDANSYDLLDKALGQCHGVDIAAKLMHRAEKMHRQLEQELKISIFLKAKNHHDNYKDIRKDVERINNLVSQAEELDIQLDSAICA